MTVEQKNKCLKMMWLLVLVLDIIFTITVVSAGNIKGCLVAIVLGLIITYKGNPIIFAQYDAEREVRYEKLKYESKKLKRAK